MGDFYQNGVITTLHNLSKRPLKELEEELVRFSTQRPMCLILPSLYSELEGEALPNIVEHLSNVPYLNEVVIGLDRADEDQYRHALKFFSQLPQRHRVLWNDGPRLREIDALLQQEGLAPQEPGKGRNVWYCLGYVQSSSRSEAIGLHDTAAQPQHRRCAAAAGRDEQRAIGACDQRHGAVARHEHVLRAGLHRR